MTKAQIRSYQKEQRDQLSKEEQITLSSEIKTRLIKSEVYQKCRNLFCFISFGSEADTHELIKQSLEYGKKVYVPRVEADKMEFYEITNLEGLVVSKFGIPEPLKEEQKTFLYQHRNYNYNNSTDNMENPYSNLILLPGLAFDRNGNRVGYGQGYYDRYLEKNLSIPFYKIALSYDFQIMDEIPAENYDIKADSIITPTKMIICNKNRPETRINTKNI